MVKPRIMFERWGKKDAVRAYVRKAGATTWEWVVIDEFGRPVDWPDPSTTWTEEEAWVEARERLRMHMSGGYEWKEVIL